MKTFLPPALLTTYLLCVCFFTEAARPVSYQLKSRQGRLQIVASTGEVIPWTSYGVSSERKLHVWAAKQTSFLKAGVRLFQLAVWPAAGNYWANPWYSLDGKPMTTARDPMTLGQQAEWLLAQAADSRFIVRFGVHPDPKWRAEHLDQYQHLNKEGMFKDGLSVLPSPASTLWLAGVEQSIRDIITWCEAQPWRDGIVGYSVFPYGEGASEIAIGGQLFDTSAPMQQAFRDYVRDKYPDDAALQAAWNDPAAKLSGVTVPEKQAWLERRDKLQIMHWPEPAEVRRERDYFDLQKMLYFRFWIRIFDTVAEVTRKRPVIKGYDTFKQGLQGWMHNADFEADWQPGTMDDYGNILLAAGATGLGPLLDHPGLDILQTPGMYYNRAIGYAWEAEGLTDSLILRGKLNFMEADIRTWVNRDRDGKERSGNIPDAGVFLNANEMRAGFDRTLAWALTRNQMFYFMSVWSGNWWYQEAPIEQHLTKIHKAVVASQALPWRDTRDAICLVIDDEAALYEDFSSGFQNLAVYRQVEDGLALCGVPYRIHLLSDLDHPNLPDYKCYLFPNLFKVDKARLAILKKRVFRNGHVAIFGPGTGITDGATRSAAGASKVLGVDMRLVKKRAARRIRLGWPGHPLGEALPNLTYGDSYSYGPMLVPAVQSFPPSGPTRELGKAFFYYFFDRPGLFITDFGRSGAGSKDTGTRGKDDYAVIFSAAVPLPPELLRACANYAGVDIAADRNTVLYGCDTLLGLHRPTPGQTRIRVPARATVTEFPSQRPVPVVHGHIQIDSAAPETRILQLSRP